jgi:hypothetical protein
MSVALPPDNPNSYPVGCQAAVVGSRRHIETELGTNITLLVTTSFPGGAPATPCTSGTPTALPVT